MLPQLLSDKNLLIKAPTGSGKTILALIAIDCCLSTQYDS
jgi:replicative superfamily II helicase